LRIARERPRLLCARGIEVFRVSARNSPFHSLWRQFYTEQCGRARRGLE
jgi:hypothetical protein